MYLVFCVLHCDNQHRFIDDDFSEYGYYHASLFHGFAFHHNLPHQISQYHPRHKFVLVTKMSQLTVAYHKD